MSLEALYFSKLSETGCVDLLLYCCERLWSIFVFVSIITVAYNLLFGPTWIKFHSLWPMSKYKFETSSLVSCKHYYMYTL